MIKTNNILIKVRQLVVDLESYQCVYWLSIVKVF